MSSFCKYASVRNYVLRVNDLFEGESELVSPYSLNGCELVYRTIALELSANDLLYWQSHHKNKEDTRAVRITDGIERKLDGNASAKVVQPAKSLADFLGFSEYHNFDGKKCTHAQARDVLNLIKSGNMGIRLIGARKDYHRERKVPLMIRANQ